MRCRVLSLAFMLAAIAVAACDGGPNPIPPTDAQFTNFETVPTRAVALSPDGSRLFALNVPDGRMEIFQVTPQGLMPESSVSVGLEPIALAVRNAGEVWVVNHVSDSVSVVDVSGPAPFVRRTLLVGDEPRDVVFAGPGGNRAFITAARRGQNHPDDTVEETQVPGIGRADVWVFDANDLGAGLGGTPLTLVTLFSDKPGALAATPDGSKVFVSVFTSGNRTTVISDTAVCGPLGASRAQQFSNQNDGPCVLPNGGTSPGGVPGPNQNQVDQARSPKVGVIATLGDDGAWRDVLGRDFSDAVPFELPDNDVFTIDANANPPRQSGVYQTVGTLNFNIAVHPTNGNAYLATIDAVNQNRFLSIPSMGVGPNPDGANGAPIQADPITGQTLRGHLYESRIAVLRPDGSFATRHLNKHIDYEAFPTPPGTLERSVANPQGVTFSPDGNTLYVAALGSNKIVPFDRAALEDDSFQPDASTHIQLSGDGGPSDMVLDPSDPNRMFVYKRFDNAIAIVDIGQQAEVSSVPLFNPEPDAVRVGRKFFYDATLTSDNGEANCNVCHPSADKDDLAWNLGTPFQGLAPNPNDFTNIGGGGGGQGLATLGSAIFGVSPTIEFNPIKGPMTVLTLRGIRDSGPLFWRGDATNAANPLDERRNFEDNFPIVFDALNGKTGGIPSAQFSQLTDWVLTLTPPPNPHQPLDGSLTADQEAGRNIYLGGEGITDVVFTCVDCHSLDPGQGFFGTAGRDSIEGETQFFKVTQLRTVYDKVGMFGHTFGDNGVDRTLGGPRVNVGPQVRATGTLHDGSAAGAEEFLTADVFQLNARQLKQVVDFSYAFPSNLAPIVGQQITLGAGSSPQASARLDLLQQRAAADFVQPGPINTTECDLVAKGIVDGVSRGYVFQPGTNSFLDDTGGSISSADLRSQAQVPGQAVTFTCVYPGGGSRIGIDRDADGTPDASDTDLTRRSGGPAPAPPTGGGAAPPPANPLGDLLGGLLGGLFGS